MYGGPPPPHFVSLVLIEGAQNADLPRALRGVKITRNVRMFLLSADFASFYHVLSGA